MGYTSIDDAFSTVLQFMSQTTRQCKVSKILKKSMTKPAEWPVYPVKTQINLGIGQVCSVFAMLQTLSLFRCKAMALIRLGGCTFL